MNEYLKQLCGDTHLQSQGTDPGLFNSSDIILLAVHEVPVSHLHIDILFAFKWFGNINLCWLHNAIWYKDLRELLLLGLVYSQEQGCAETQADFLTVLRSRVFFLLR